MAGILTVDTPWDDLDGSLGGGNGSAGGGGTSTYSDAVVPETGTLQILLGLGRMEGLVNGLKSIYFDKTPLQNADGSFNFKGVSLALVAGTNTQPAVKGIAGVESETLVDVAVTQAAPVVRSITSNPSAVRVRLSLPALKVIDSATGKSSGHNVEIKIERQNASYNGGAWETVVSGAAGTIAGGPFSTKFTKAFRIDTPATGTWQIKVSRVSPDDADIWHLSQTKWDAFTEIIDAKFRHPNMAVLSCRVNAKQFRSIPQITCHMKGRRIQVPANYTPASYDWTTKTWTGAVYRTTGTGTSAGAWDGTFSTLYSSNPAWVFYDACTSKLAGAGAFLNAGQIDKWALYQIAQWCDACETGTYVGVSDGRGGLEPRVTCNLYLQGQQNAIKALTDLASIFSGILYYSAGQVVPVADTDAAPVALFTNANVEEGKFQYQGTALQARHTSAIVRFQNPELGYELDSAIYDPAMDPVTLAILGYDPVARYGRNVLDLQGIGCNSPGQALRMAKHAILSELLAPEIVGFVTGLEGSHRRPFDVVQVADQFRAGNARAGGRVVSATTTSVSLDAPVTLGAGTYILRCQTDAGMESKTVTTGAGTTSTLAVSGAFSTAPAAGSNWLLQAGSSASLWRVLSVKKADGLKYEINALTHDPAKYVALGLTAGDVVTRTGSTGATTAPSGLAVTDSVCILNDRQVQTLSASWTLDGAAGYIAQASRDYGPWEDMTVSGPSAYLDGIQPGSWRVRVAGDWRASGLSPWSTASATVTASSAKPGWVASALAAIADWGSDGILSVGEKPAAIANYTGLSGQVTALRAQATAIGATLPTANTLLAYLTSLGPYNWNDTTALHDTTIPVPATWTSKWNEIYAEVAALNANIAAKLNTGVTAAAGSATWGGITGALAQAAPAGGWTGNHGAMSIGALTATSAALSLSSTITNSSDAGLQWVITNNSTGLSASSGFLARNDSNNQTYILMYGSGRTATLFGKTIGNWGFLGASQAAGLNGLLFGVQNVDKPIVIGINNIQVAEFTGGTLASQSFKILYSTASTSTVTGAFVVVGGIGAGGAVSADKFVATSATGILGQHIQAGTTQRFIQLGNTGGSTYMGIESSVAGGFFPGSAAYGTVIYSPNNEIALINNTGGIRLTTTAGVGAPLSMGTLTASNIFSAAGITINSASWIGASSMSIAVPATFASSVSTGGDITCGGDWLNLKSGYGAFTTYWAGAGGVANTLYTRSSGAFGYEFGLLNGAQTVWVMRSTSSGDVIFGAPTVTFDADSKVVVDPGIGSVYIRAAVGGWAEIFGTRNRAMTSCIGGFGMYGSGDAVSYGFIGVDYNAWWMKIDPSGNGTFAGSLTTPWVSNTLGREAFGSAAAPAVDGTRWFWRNGNQLNWRGNGTVDEIIYTTGNIGTNATIVMAAVAQALAPKWVAGAGSLSALNASIPLPNANYPAAYWDAAMGVYQGGYVCDLTTKKMYQNQAGTWVSVGVDTAIFGQVTAAQISATSIGAGALVSDFVLVNNILRSTGYATGAITPSAGAPPQGFKLAGNNSGAYGPFAANCYNGDTTTDNASGVQTTKNVIMELGGNISLNGYYVGDLALGKLVNGGQKIFNAGASGTWTCPPGIYWVEVTIGAGGGNGATNSGGGGAGGAVRMMYAVSPGTGYAYSVGAGGTGDGGNGGNSTFGTITCTGGLGGNVGTGGGVSDGTITLNATPANTNSLSSSTATHYVIAPGAGGKTGGGGAGGSCGVYTGGNSSTNAGGGGASAFARGSNGLNNGINAKPGYSAGAGGNVSGTLASGGDGILILRW